MNYNFQIYRNGNHWIADCVDDDDPDYCILKAKYRWSLRRLIFKSALATIDTPYNVEKKGDECSFWTWTKGISRQVVEKHVITIEKRKENENHNNQHS